jgi:hypothetical protein
MQTISDSIAVRELDGVSFAGDRFSIRRLTGIDCGSFPEPRMNGQLTSFLQIPDNLPSQPPDTSSHETISTCHHHGLHRRLFHR